MEIQCQQKGMQPHLPWFTALYWSDIEKRRVRPAGIFQIMDILPLFEEAFNEYRWEINDPGQRIIREPPMGRFEREEMIV
jgi:hypothetical protein